MVYKRFNGMSRVCICITGELKLCAKNNFIEFVMGENFGTLESGHTYTSTGIQDSLPR